MAEQHPTEIWRPVVGFEADYEVSNFGGVRRSSPGMNTYAGRVLHPSRDRDGYRRASLRGRDGHVKLYAVHRLVAEAFLPPLIPFVNHKNGRRDDNRVRNLEWCTNSENLTHGYRVLKRRAVVSLKGETNPFAKLTPDIIPQIRAARESGESYISIGRRFSIHKNTARLICLRERWKHVA